LRWLLVFDNVEDPVLLNPYWPKGAKGTIIVTTRNPEVARLYPAFRIEIQPFSNVDSRKFLIKIVYEDADENYDPSSADVASADQVASALGHLPLALDLVGSYTASRGMTLPRFREVHGEYDRKFIFQNPTGLHWDAQAYQRSLNSTFTFNLEFMDSNTRLLIDLVAFLDPDGVPTSLFHPKPRERK
jgi:hypothetical protein